jgi:hypothetical protein
VGRAASPGAEHHHTDGELQQRNGGGEATAEREVLHGHGFHHPAEELPRSRAANLIMIRPERPEQQPPFDQLADAHGHLTLRPERHQPEGNGGEQEQRPRQEPRALEGAAQGASPEHPPSGDPQHHVREAGDDQRRSARRHAIRSQLRPEALARRDAQDPDAADADATKPLRDEDLGGAAASLFTQRAEPAVDPFSGGLFDRTAECLAQGLHRHVGLLEVRAEQGDPAAAPSRQEENAVLARQAKHRRGTAREPVRHVGVGHVHGLGLEPEPLRDALHPSPERLLGLERRAVGRRDGDGARRKTMALRQQLQRFCGARQRPAPLRQRRRAPPPVGAEHHGGALSPHHRIRRRRLSLGDACGHRFGIRCVGERTVSVRVAAVVSTTRPCSTQILRQAPPSQSPSRTSRSAVSMAAYREPSSAAR